MKKSFNYIVKKQMKNILNTIILVILSTILSYGQNGNNYFPAGACNRERILFTCDQMPQLKQSYQEVEQKVNESLNLTKKQKRLKTSVLIEFVINCEGEDVDYRVLRSEIPELNKQLVDMVSQNSDWEVGKQRSEPVDCHMALALQFREGQVPVKKMK